MRLLNFFIRSALVLVCLSLAACGGVGGETTTYYGTPAAKTIISGIAMKGPFFKWSTVSVYAVTNGIKGALIGQTKTTDDNGSYRADVGSYTGPVIVEVSGSYQDEATGNIVPVLDTKPIRAALPQVQGNVTLPVTPLTELAVQKTGGAMTAEAITAANTLISEVFKVDIVNTAPVVPKAEAVSAATQSQKDYTLALAAVSQLASASAGANDTAKLQTALATLSQNITETGMSSAVATTFQTALADFVTTNAHNQTGVTDTSTTSLVNVGTLSRNYTLFLQGDTSVGPVKGVQFDLALPQGVTVNVNSADGTILSSSLQISNSGPTDALLSSRLSSGTITVGMVSAQGISPGGFAMLTCNTPAGTTAPAAAAFAVKNLKVIGTKGDSLTGLVVTVD